LSHAAEGESRFAALSDEDLAGCCAKRPVDEEAWLAFYVRFHGYVRYLVWSRLSGSVGEVEDLVQQAFLKIFTALPKFQKRKAKLRTFLSTVVVNLVIDFLRHGARLREQTYSLEDDLGVLQLHARQDPGILHQAAEHVVNRVANTSRIPFLRDVLRGETAEELCRRHAVSVHDIRTAKRWLRARLAELPDKLPNYC